jgi:putative membrane protein
MRLPATGLFLILLLGVLVLAFVYLGIEAFKPFRLHPDRCNQDRVSSLEILNIRYAKGELTEEEYRRMKDILMN